MSCSNNEGNQSVPLVFICGGTSPSRTTGIDLPRFIANRCAMRTRTFSALIVCLLPFGAACAGEVKRHEFASSWKTTISASVAQPQSAPKSSPPAVKLLSTASIPPIKPTPSHGLEGIASFYWQPQKTASGEMFDKSGLTAAHRTLPFGTRVRVIHVQSGRAVIVRINDRGPFKPGRVIDLSEAAARQLEMEKYGLARVRLEVMH